jgi:hypothetical protein
MRSWVLAGAVACNAPEVREVSSAVAQTKDAVETVSKKADSVIDDISDGSDRAEAWLAGAEEGSIERLAAKSSTAGELARIAQALNDAVDSETIILPIYRPVANDQDDIDKAIGDMPRREVVDGLTVGFKTLDHTDTRTKKKEEGYLVLWRRDGHLIGFVYRKKTAIDLDQVVKQIPRLVAIANQAVAG